MLRLLDLYCGGGGAAQGYYNAGLQDPFTSYVTVTGGGNAPIEACKSAMNIDWMPRKQLNQAIPPPYTEYIGKQLVMQLTQ